MFVCVYANAADDEDDNNTIEKAFGCCIDAHTTAVIVVVPVSLSLSLSLSFSHTRTMTDSTNATTTTTTTTTGTPVQDNNKYEILVLFASQTGNSEQAARDLCQQIPEKLSAAGLRQRTGQSIDTKDETVVSCRHLQLDDFLEVEKAPWTRLVILCMSSYGVGQAPLGGYRFRELCDYFLDNTASTSTLLKGVRFALLGLGDSMYTTFLENPIVTEEALQAAGAVRVGEFGKADASGDQLKAVEQWMDGIWPALASVVVEDLNKRNNGTDNDVDLDKMQKETMKICYRINPDLKASASSFSGEGGMLGGTSGNINMVMIVVSVLVGLLAVAVYYTTVLKE